ncbi:MAG: hypothetical protein V3U83_00040, partial [Acidobacteriota bacterium]
SLAQGPTGHADASEARRRTRDAAAGVDLISEWMCVDRQSQRSPPLAMELHRRASRLHLDQRAAAVAGENREGGRVVHFGSGTRDAPLWRDLPCLRRGVDGNGRRAAGSSEKSRRNVSRPSQITFSANAEAERARLNA